MPTLTWGLNDLTIKEKFPGAYFGEKCLSLPKGGTIYNFPGDCGSLLIQGANCLTEIALKDIEEYVNILKEQGKYKLNASDEMFIKHFGSRETVDAYIEKLISDRVKDVFLPNDFFELESQSIEQYIREEFSYLNKKALDKLVSIFAPIRLYAIYKKYSFVKSAYEANKKQLLNATLSKFSKTGKSKAQIKYSNATGNFSVGEAVNKYDVFKGTDKTAIS